MNLDHLIYALFFILGFSVSELFGGLRSYVQLKRIADRLEKVRD